MTCQQCGQPAWRYRMPKGDWCERCCPTITPAGPPGSWWRLPACNVCGRPGVAIDWHGRRRQPRCCQHLPDQIRELLNHPADCPTCGTNQTPTEKDET